MYEDVGAADTMIARLSEFLRLTLHRADEQEVRLSGELELLDAWLAIMRARFEDNLDVEMAVDPDARPVWVPQLILQPLVENSVRYGADPVTHRIAIRIEASRINGHLSVKVRDHGPGIENLREGVGLSNTRNRLSKLYGNRHEFSLSNASGGGLEVAIELPWRQ
jgi:LytS/YehU family sensor histidine kinase